MASPGASLRPLPCAHFISVSPVTDEGVAYSSAIDFHQSLSASMSQTWSQRMSFLHCRQVLIRSANPPTWPEATQVFGFMMIVQSRPTMSTGFPSGPTSSRSTTSFHHAFFRFRLSAVPSGP